MDHTQQPQQPVYYRAGPRNGFGITSLCLALAGLVFSLMPITGFIAVILGAFAILFGLLGLARVRRHEASNRKTSALGLTFGLIAAALGVWGVVLFFGALNQLSTDLNNIPQVPAPVAPSGY